MMEIEKLVKRINELSKKSKVSGLTNEEQEEQKSLRAQYINLFKSNLKSTLDSIVVVDKNGNKTALKSDKGSV